jgi:hypothetical protein
MASEKVCKAHLAMGSGHESIRKTHAYVASVLPTIARQFYATISDENQMPNWQMDRIKRMAREIEVIAPACDAGDVREDDSEYPWLDGSGMCRFRAITVFRI